MISSIWENRVKKNQEVAGSKKGRNVSLVLIGAGKLNKGEDED